MSLGLPYNTIDGGMWLKKALDPADIDTQVAGLPDINTNPRTVLNYQYQSDIPLPAVGSYNPNISQSYDSDFYVYQNPITFGMSASRPSGLKPIQGGTLIRIATTGEIYLPGGEVPSTIQLFENPQIEGTTKNEKIRNLEKYCQKYRMIYGGVQCIPACSQMFDSGTIEATQQCFSPKNSFVKNVVVNDDVNVPSPVVACQTFFANDFPDNGSAIQSTSTLYCRYKEGTYMPYKLKNPLVYDYKSSEQTTLNVAPYLLVDNVSIEVTHSGGSKNSLILKYDPDNNKFTNPNITNISFTDATNVYWQFECYTKTGIRFFLKINIVAPINGEAFNGLIQQEFELPEVLPAYQMNPSELVKMFTFPPIQYDEHDMPTSGYIYSTSIFTANQISLNASDKTKSELVMPYQETNLGLICFRSVGLQATVRVIFRFGLEMMITVGGIYSPFKHKAPRYDQKALNSYVRACHNMKDAFLGNAASPAGHDAYTAYLLNVVNTDAATGLTNLGSGWNGNVNV